MAATLEHCVLEIRKLQQQARRSGEAFRPRWPMVILRSPKGWTAPREVEGHYLEGFWRAHQIPLTGVATDPRQFELLESWLHSYKPEGLFDDQGRLLPDLKALAPTGSRRMSANPVANGGLLRRPLNMPDFRGCAVKVEKPGATLAGNVPTLGNFLREIMRLNTHNFRVVGPDETQSNKLEALYDVTRKVWLADHFPEDADGGELAPDGCVMEMLSEHTVEGWLEGYPLSGRHGLINSYEPFMSSIRCSTGTPSGWKSATSCSGAPKYRHSTCLSRRWRVNVVDLAKLVPDTEHPHGLTDHEFEALFTPDKPVVFNFHGYPWLIHRLTYRRPGQPKIHVRGYKEHGNIDTPLELAIRNQTRSRASGPALASIPASFCPLDRRARGSSVAWPTLNGGS